MKKKILLASAALTAGSFALAETEHYFIEKDLVVDGQVSTEPFERQGENFEVQQQQNTIIGEETWSQSNGLLKGHKAHEDTLIQFTITDSNTTEYYTGILIGKKAGLDVYQGTWYSSDGESGDFVTNCSTCDSAASSTGICSTPMAEDHFSSSTGVCSDSSTGICSESTTGVCSTSTTDSCTSSTANCAALLSPSFINVSEKQEVDRPDEWKIGVLEQKA